MNKFCDTWAINFLNPKAILKFRTVVKVGFLKKLSLSFISFFLFIGLSFSLNI